MIKTFQIFPNPRQAEALMIALEMTGEKNRDEFSYENDEFDGFGLLAFPNGSVSVKSIYELNVAKHMITMPDIFDGHVTYQRATIPYIHLKMPKHLHPSVTIISYHMGMWYVTTSKDIPWILDKSKEKPNPIFNPFIAISKQLTKYVGLYLKTGYVHFKRNPDGTPRRRRKYEGKTWLVNETNKLPPKC